MNELEVLQRRYHDSTAFAREWQASGGKVVGYFCSTVPEELIIAAGFLPLRVKGVPGSDTRKAAEYLGPAEGYALSMLGLILSGEYSFLDYLIVPHSRSSVHKIYSVLKKIRETQPDTNIPELYFLDHTHTSFMTSQLFNRNRMMELKGQLETWAGRSISDGDLSAAIALCNENRDLLKQLAALRVSPSQPVSGTDALQIIGASMFMEKKAHNELLRSFLDSAGSAPARDGVRIFFSGGPQDNLQMYELAEACGATIVAEDHCWGNRWSDTPVDEKYAPMDAIIRRYNTKSPCPSTFPLQGRVDYCVNSVRQAGVQGVIFYCLKNDPQAWDIPDEIKALEAEGIPTLYLMKQKYAISDADAIKESVTAFVAKCAQTSNTAADGQS